MQPLMPKATAVWLVDNTTLTFDQIAEFTGLHRLEVSGIADGEVAIGIKGFDPIANNQLAREEIARCEQDPKARLRLKKGVQAPPVKKKAVRYTPLSKRQERPAAIAWLVRNHPELADAQISKLLQTTKTTIEAIRNKTHWNSANIQPVDPVALGLCRQVELDAAVKVAAERRAREAEAQGLTPVDAGKRLMTTEESLSDAAPAPNPFAEFDEVTTEREAREPSPDAASVFGDAPEPEAEAEDADDDPAFDPDNVFARLKGLGSEADDDAEDDAAAPR